MNNKIKKKKKVKTVEFEEPTRDSNQDTNENIIINRKHTKVTKKKKVKKEEKKIEEENNTRKVKFGNIDIIDVECWKKINLKLTAEENFEELFKISDVQAKKRMKNIGCTCIII